MGTRHFGIKRWDGPGVPVFFGFRQETKDWLIYDDNGVLGLDPLVTYFFDESLKRSPTRFHVTSVPDDFVGINDLWYRIPPQEVGRDDSFFRLFFAGHGEMTMYVPDDYEVFLDGRRLEVDHETKTASAIINASAPSDHGMGLGYFILLNEPKEASNASESEGRPSMLIAFKKSDAELSGRWIDLSWQQSKDSAKWVHPNDEGGFSMNVGAFGIMIGKLPQASSIRLEGSYKITTGNENHPGDGLVLINGKEVLRVPAGTAPYTRKKFVADISEYAGQDVLMEFMPDGPVRGTYADWFEPRITVER